MTGDSYLVSMDWVESAQGDTPTGMGVFVCLYSVPKLLDEMG